MSLSTFFTEVCANLHGDFVLNFSDAQMDTQRPHNVSLKIGESMAPCDHPWTLFWCFKRRCSSLGRNITLGTKHEETGGQAQQETRGGHPWSSSRRRVEDEGEGERRAVRGLQRDKAWGREAGRLGCWCRGRLWRLGGGRAWLRGQARRAQGEAARRWRWPPPSRRPPRVG